MAALLPEEFRTLFLGDLSIHCTRQDVVYLFHPFGSIERITLKVGASMKGLGYGFISFTNRENAEAAMNNLQGAILLGRALRLSWATPRGQTHLISKEPVKSNKQTAEVHFSFLTKQTTYLITEATIRQQYEKFGDIIDVVIKRTKLNEKLNFQNGYGFVRYELCHEGIQAAINATKFMHQVNVDGVNYDTHLTHALETLLERYYPEMLREHRLSTMSSSRSSLIHSPDQMMMEDGFRHSFEFDDTDQAFANELPKNYPPAGNYPPASIRPISHNLNGLKIQEPRQPQINPNLPPRYVPNSSNSFSSYGSQSSYYSGGFSESKLSHPPLNYETSILSFEENRYY